MLFHGNAISRKCYFTEMLFQGNAISQKCYFTEMLFHGNAISRKCYFTEMLFHQVIFQGKAISPSAISPTTVYHSTENCYFTHQVLNKVCIRRVTISSRSLKFEASRAIVNPEGSGIVDRVVKGFKKSTCHLHYVATSGSSPPPGLNDKFCSL
jgi:hypothetical protein